MTRSGPRPVVSEYLDLLGRGSTAEDCAGALRAGQEARQLVFGNRPLCISLRPQLIERSRYEAARAASERVYRALQTLERALLHDADLRRELDLLPEEEELALADPGARSSSPSARIDGFLTDKLRFVEYNAESPAGMAYSDNLAAAFAELPVLRAFRKRWRLRGLPTRERQVASMLRAFGQWGGAERPAIAIVDWKGLPTVAEFGMFRDHFEAQGIRTVICDPGELEYRRRRLYANGTPVNLVYRRVLTTELIERGTGFQTLRRAYLDGAVCVVNTFRAKLLHKKMSLALLSDGRYARLYTASQRETIARHIPWTRKVANGSTTYRGRRVRDLPAFVLANRDRLVLKPNDEYGGKGVVLGWTVSDGGWELALAGALAESSVVQEAVPIPKEPFPIVLEGTIDTLDLAMDMDPYLFDGRASGCLTRLSSAALLNVTAGAGSVVPTYVVEGRA
jgi:hypothetical protein